MNTKIISISDDQNTITHESGLVTEFVESDHLGCFYCVYETNDTCFDKPCMEDRRLNKLDGIFKLKTT